MTEENLEMPRKKASKRRIAGLVLAALGLLAAVAWLARQPIAEAIVRGVCSEQKLTCELSVSRLDFGGVTLARVDVRAPSAPSAAVTVDEVAIDLAWDNLFAPRPLAVTGSGLVLRLDLTGRRSLLGDLETAVTSFTQPSDAPPGPLPRLDLKDVTVIGETLSGDLVAKATITTSAEQAIVVQASAPASSLGLNGATVSLTGAELKATIDGEHVSAALKLDLSRFESASASMSDVKIDASVDQVGGVLKGAGSASLGALNAGDAKLNNATASGEIEAASITGDKFTLARWLSQVRMLELSATTGEGSAPGVSWDALDLKARIQPDKAGGSSGELAFGADDVSTAQMFAGRVDIVGTVAIADGVIGSARGDFKARSVGLTGSQRSVLGAVVSGPLGPVLPAFGEAAQTALDRAGRSFDVSAPWSIAATDVITFALNDQLELKAASGLTLRLTPPAGTSEIVTLSNAEDGFWRGAGALNMSGGGAPSVNLDVKRAEGIGNKLWLEGALSLRPWKVGSDAVAMELSALTLETAGASGSAAGAMDLKVDGRFAGGVWKGARANARLSATWTPDGFVAETPDDATIAWTEAVYGDTRFGAAQLRYTPAGALARSAGGGVSGRGTLHEVVVPVSSAGFTATTRLGATTIDWRTAGSLRASLDMKPSSVDLKLDQEVIAIAIEDIKGNLELASGWKLAGAMSGGAVTSSTAVLSQLSSKFDLTGRGDQISGSLSDVTTKISDPLAGAGKRYEDAHFAGGASLASGVVNFNGRITLDSPGVQIAQITGRHSLEENAGFLTFDPTPLVFSRRAFQPFHLSPLLIGPAAVTGRVDISGGASWADGRLNANAALDLRKVGFVLASAGAFEGVSGRVEVSDLLNLKSAPGQKLTIDKVTLGLPIEKGEIEFQLIGSEAIRLQRAEWPFVGGFIRVKPTDFTFASTAENVIVAQAVDWNLATLVRQFEIPDLKLEGTVGGDFPVVFSAGSAEIDDAVLASSGPGVIRYGGDTVDAVAQADAATNIVMDALKDFRFQVLKIGLDGNLAGKMILTLDMLGRNPAVMNGQSFQMNISIDSELAKLVNSLTLGTDVRAAIGGARQQSTEDPQ